MSRELDQNLSDSITLSNIHKEDIPLQVMMDNYTAEEEVEQLRAIQTENHINEQPDEADDFENDVPDEDDSNPDDKSLHFCQYCPARFLSPRVNKLNINFIIYCIIFDLVRSQELFLVYEINISEILKKIKFILNF